MLHKGTVPLETSRLILRAFRASDTSAMFHNWASDEKVTEFLRWPAHKSVETTEKVLKIGPKPMQSRIFTNGPLC